MFEIHLAVTEANSTHRHFTVFVNGANCGHLIMRNTEFWEFGRALIKALPDQVRISLAPSPAASGDRQDVQRGDGRTTNGRKNDPQ